MSRMKKYLALLLAIVMITALVGCGETNGNDRSQNNTGNTTQDSNQGDGDQDNQDSQPQEGEADADSYINCLINGEPSTLDLAKFMQVYDRSVLQNILEPLTRIQDGVVVGAGAESWTVSDDGLTYTFKLRENSWSEG